MTARWRALSLVGLLLACGASPPPPAATTPTLTLERARHDGRHEGARSVQEPAATPGRPLPPGLPRVAELGGDAATAQRFRIPTDLAPSRGAPLPTVTIVEFADYQCPFSGRVQPAIEQVVRTFPTDVRLYYRHNVLPFHQLADEAAELAIEAQTQGGNTAFWRVHEILFENQRELERPALEQYATQAGLDMTRVRTALDAHTHLARVTDETRQAGTVGSRGTPGFFINGRLLMGAQPYEAFETIIREEVALAEVALRRGVPRNQLYAWLMVDAAERAPEPEPPPPVRPRDPDAEARIIYRVPVGSAPQRGPNDALVTIVEFSDFQCPFCQRVQQTLREIEQRYGRDVRFVFRNYPLAFHPDAMLAAEAAMEAHAQRGDRGFGEMHALLFENQRALSRADLERYAQRLRLDLRRFRRALDTHVHRPAIATDMGLATAIGVSGTPSFFINGRMLVGSQPLDAFVTVIDEQRARASALVAAGTPRSRVYEELIRNGATSPP